MSPAKIETLTGNDERTTPRSLYQTLHRMFKFDYDAFAAHENALCVKYSTKEGTYKGGERLSSHDGLNYSWSRERVFLNPPYSRGMITSAMKKCFEERTNAEIIVALVPFDPSTKWWQKYIGLHGEHAFVEPVPYRVRFGPGSGAGATFPSAVVVWRPVL